MGIVSWKGKFWNVWNLYHLFVSFYSNKARGLTVNKKEQGLILADWCVTSRGGVSVVTWYKYEAFARQNNINEVTLGVLYHKNIILQSSNKITKIN